MSDLHTLTLKEAIAHARQNGAAGLISALKERANKLNSKTNAFLRWEKAEVISGAAAGLWPGFLSR